MRVEPPYRDHGEAGQSDVAIEEKQQETPAIVVILNEKSQVNPLCTLT